MSITLLSALSSAAKFDPVAEKDAQQKALEAGAGAFADVLAQTNATPASTPPDVTLVTAQRGNAVIPAVLIDLGAENSITMRSAMVLNAVDQTKDTTETFLDFARKSPAEQMRAMVLSELGLSEDALQGLDAEARAVIEAKIQTRIEEKIRQGIEKDSGVKVG